MTTLESSLSEEIERIDNRTKQLMDNIADYRKSNDFESAMKCDIKWRTLKMVSQNLKKLLKGAK